MLKRRSLISLTALTIICASIPAWKRHSSLKPKEPSIEITLQAMHRDIAAGFNLNSIPPNDLLAFYHGEHSKRLHSKLYNVFYLRNTKELTKRNNRKFGTPGYFKDPSLAEVQA